MSPSLQIASPERLGTVINMCWEVETGGWVQVVRNECSAAAVGATRVVFASSDAQSRREYALGDGVCSRGNGSG